MNLARRLGRQTWWIELAQDQDALVQVGNTGAHDDSPELMLGTFAALL